jgi:hypothetical protein
MNFPLSYITTVLLLFLLGVKGKSQSYHAFSGSPYAGVNAMYNNPASTVNAPFNWDVTLFAMQSSIANTAFVIKNNSLINSNNSSLFISGGAQPRYFTNNLDINLLNFRVKINHKSAFAAGLRVRGYTNIVARSFAYSDTMHTLQSFLQANNYTANNLDGSLTHAGWAEFNFNYSRILVQNPASYLSAGVTLSYMRGLSGAFAHLSNVSYNAVQTNTSTYYNLLQASMTAEYSANYQVTNNNNSNPENVKTFIKGALPSFGVDIGAEYLFKNYEGSDDEAVNATNYDWKIGFSIMDIGRNKFNPITGSFSVNNPKNINDTLLQNQLKYATNIQDVRDTLQKLFNTFYSLHNRFNISLPTRLVVSVDRNFGSHFYVNGEVSLNFFSTKQPGSLKTGDLNLLTITPRWETSAWGLYLPVQYNAHGLFWVGAAIKLGPLLVGVHNLDFLKWFKTGTQTYNGGGYILLSIHPFERKKDEDKLPCPKV